MNFVEPIRDRKKIAQIKNQLRGQRRSRDLLLFVVGVPVQMKLDTKASFVMETFTTWIDYTPAAW